MNTKAKFEATGGNTKAWFAFRGSKVLCDRLIRARRFNSADAALKAGTKASDEQFH